VETGDQIALDALNADTAPKGGTVSSTIKPRATVTIHRNDAENAVWSAENKTLPDSHAQDVAGGDSHTMVEAGTDEVTEQAAVSNEVTPLPDALPSEAARISREVTPSAEALKPHRQSNADMLTQSRIRRARVPEELAEIRIGPFEDEAGNYHPAGTMFIVLRPGRWKGAHAGDDMEIWP